MDLGRGRVQRGVALAALVSLAVWIFSITPGLMTDRVPDLPAESSSHPGGTATTGSPMLIPEVALKRAAALIDRHSGDSIYRDRKGVAEAVTTLERALEVATGDDLDPLAWALAEAYQDLGSFGPPARSREIASQRAAVLASLRERHPDSVRIRLALLDARKGSPEGLSNDERLDELLALRRLEPGHPAILAHLGFAKLGWGHFGLN